MSAKQPFACDHVGFFTGRADRLVSFYTGKLGFALLKDDVLPRAMTQAIFSVARDCRFIKLAAGSLMLEIFEPVGGKPQSRSPGAAGVNHFGLRVGDGKKFVAALRRKKVRIIDVRRNGKSVYFIADPDGNRIEIRA
ncbi:MAG: VOC family protein [Pseudomonadota bacterium]